jgi:hypothetical protein
LEKVIKEAQEEYDRLIKQTPIGKLPIESIKEYLDKTIKNK